MSVPNPPSCSDASGAPTTLSPNPTSAASRPSLHLDWEAWLPYLDDPTATEDEKRQLIETLWSIVIAFVDLQWNIVAEPAPKTSGQVLHLTTALNAAVLDWKTHTNEKEDV
ncbi:hypothetical protein [Gymnodinialimonas sp.]